MTQKCKGQEMRVCLSLAAFPGKHLEDLPSSSVFQEPAWGALSESTIQITPQIRDVIDDDFLDRIRHRWPGADFRLHASIKVEPFRCRIEDLSSYQKGHPYHDRVRALCGRVGAKAYTAHPGLADDCSLTSLLDRVRQANQDYGCPVGVEGMYPARGKRYLLSTWEEHRQLLESQVPYALDLSHLNILTKVTGRLETTLVAEMLSSSACLEVHLSQNDGFRDLHEVSTDPTGNWWSSLLPHIHPDAVVFSEGNLRRDAATPGPRQ